MTVLDNLILRLEFTHTLGNIKKNENLKCYRKLAQHDIFLKSLEKKNRTHLWPYAYVEQLTQVLKACLIYG